MEEDPYAEVARDNAIAVERRNEREDDEDHDDKKTKVKACTYHPDGQHRFLACDDRSPTCWCGKTQY